MSERNCSLQADASGVLRGVVVAVFLAALFGMAPARADSLYLLDQRVGSIAFSVRHLGLFSSQGEFRRFSGQLVLDGVHPERTQVSVKVDAASVDMAWDDGAAKLRSPDFFDVERHPVIRFTSTSVVPVGPDRYDVRGMVEIRGVTRTLVLHATLVGRHRDPAVGGEVAEFVAAGSLRRSMFGMTSDQTLISDSVHIAIAARIALSEAARTN